MRRGDPASPEALPQLRLDTARRTRPLTPTARSRPRQRPRSDRHHAGSHQSYI